MALEASEKGYRAVTVADIVSRAGIARNTFYENFSSKEDCFLAAQKYAMSAALGRVVEAAGEIDDWPYRVEAGLAAFLAYVAEEPALARTCMVEALAAGPPPSGTTRSRCRLSSPCSDLDAMSRPMGRSCRRHWRRR